MSTSTDTSGLRTRIRELREARGRAVRELAKHAGMHHATVARVEDGSIDPRIVVLDAIATALGCDGRYTISVAPVATCVLRCEHA